MQADVILNYMLIFYVCFVLFCFILFCLPCGVSSTTLSVGYTIVVSVNPGPTNIALEGGRAKGEGRERGGSGEGL